MNINERIILFAKDQATVEDIRDYFNNYLDETLLARAYAKQDIKDLAEAKQVINSCIDKMIMEAKGQSTQQYINENE